ncbi:tigger transposable element-derived protein 6-like [Tetranychus urticae]|uniref:tigger transposable element-derived protein 6-like n=1 Tax=Tetranychus urticae TaxID=32264 RepID=UPI00077B976A|nr:tigger transposable element-derived protein 6-like [Tetranychus urticae]
MPRVNLTINEKLKLISDFDSGIPRLDLSKKYRVDRTTVCRIISKREELEMAISIKSPKLKRLNVFKDDFDEKILEFISKSLSQGIPVNNCLIRQYASNLADETRKDFKCSNGWWEKFQKRYDIKYGKLSGESNAVDMEIVKNYRIDVIPKLIATDKQLIFNCDETSFFYKCYPSNSYYKGSIKKHGLRFLKDRITILLSVNLLGNKLEPFFIGKSANPRCFSEQNGNNLLSKIEYASNSNAWMTKELFHRWLTKWHKNLEVERKQIILVMDNFSAHKLDQDDFPLIKFHFLPPNTTSHLQPLDGGIINCLKKRYLTRLFNWILSKITSNEDITTFMKDLKLNKAIIWLIEAWQSIPETMIRNCWTHCGYMNFDSQMDLVNEDDNFEETCARMNNLSPLIVPSSEQLNDMIDAFNETTIISGEHQ